MSLNEVVPTNEDEDILDFPEALARCLKNFCFVGGAPNVDENFDVDNFCPLDELLQAFPDVQRQELPIDQEWGAPRVPEAAVDLRQDDQPHGSLIFQSDEFCTGFAQVEVKEEDSFAQVNCYVPPPPMDDPMVEEIELSRAAIAISQSVKTNLIGFCEGKCISGKMLTKILANVKQKLLDDLQIKEEAPAISFAQGPVKDSTQIKGKNITPISVLKVEGDYLPNDVVYTYLMNKTLNGEVIHALEMPLDTRCVNPSRNDGLMSLKKLKIDPHTLRGNTKGQGQYFLRYELKRDSKTVSVATSPYFNLQAHGQKRDGSECASNKQKRVKTE